MKKINKKKILLIDDEKDFCFFLKQNFSKSEEFSLSYATDADKGISLAKKDPPDLILLDIMMPRKNGLRVLEILKEDKKTMSIPTIMLTAIDDEGTKIKAAHLYGEDYIVKPVSYGLLKSKIEEVINRQKKLSIGGE